MKVFILVLIGFAGFSCINQTPDKNNIWQSYPDVLNYSLYSDSLTGWPQNCFYDLGSWDGYALPADTGHYGSFIGPFMAPQKKWLSNSPLLRQDRILSE